MKLSHSAIISPIFKLIGTYEIDLELNQDEWPTRIELFQAINIRNTYRARMWQVDFFRLDPTFNESAGSSERPKKLKDEEIQVERSGVLSEEILNFEATDEENAMTKVEYYFKQFLSDRVGQD
jgi:hypothetical protein